MSPEQSGLCDGPLSLSECHSSLLGMALRKAPGCDGLPAEFYLKFWDVSGADLVEVLNLLFIWVSGSRTQCRGLIALSFKKGDRLDPRKLLVYILYIGDSVVFLHDIVSYASLSGTPVAILSLDQENAFGRVDWSFLRSTLVRIGFGVFLY